MHSLTDINYIKDLLRRNNFKFSKSLGQNFLVNPEVCPQMAEYAVTDENMGVIEIGAGVGVLTKELAKLAKKVVSIELDTGLLPILGETLGEFENIEIINEDVLKADLHKIIKEHFGDMKVAVCANLPYYITSPVIMKLLESRLPLENITVMVQKEAADRLCAEVGSRAAGAVTVSVDYYSEAEKLFDVFRDSFIPSPKVDSAVIQLSVRKEPAIDIADEKLFFRMVKAAFAQRRKTALNSLSAGMSIPKEKIARAINNAGFRPDLRAESLSMEDLAKLSNAIYEVENA